MVSPRIIVWFGVSFVASGSAFGFATMSFDLTGLVGSRPVVPAAGLDVDRRPARPAEPAPLGNPLWTIRLEALPASHARPLFSPSRRPPSPPVATSYEVATVARPVEPERPPLMLVGTIVAEGAGFAVFIERSTSAVVRLKAGEAHDGWVLRRVDRRAATLEKNGFAAMVTLPGPADQPQARQPVPVPVAATQGGKVEPPVPGATTEQF